MRPSPRLIRTTWGPVLLAIAACAFPLWIWIWSIGLFLWAVVALIDAVILWFIDPPTLIRRVDRTLPLGVWSKVHLALTNASKRPIKVKVHDFHPPQFQARLLPIDLEVPAQTEVDQYYEVHPILRGLFQFAKTQVLLGSPWGLWYRNLTLGETSEVRVYPDFRAVSKYLMMDINQQLDQIGVHRKRRRGEGRDFNQLRDYVRGDELRSIDWKATSRMQKLITREYCDERDQRVIFLLDCGQGMRTQDGDLSHFDHALNGIVLLSSVALRHGDGVGLITFGGVKRRLAVRKSHAQVNLLLDTVFDIQPGLHTPDYLTLARDVLATCPKRALIVLVTNLKEEDGTELQTAMAMLRRKHLVLLTSMRERILDELLDADIDSFEDALRLSATHVYLQDRRKTREALAAMGILCADVIPEHLPIAMVNNYLSIKSQGLL